MRNVRLVWISAHAGPVQTLWHKDMTVNARAKHTRQETNAFNAERIANPVTRQAVSHVRILTSLLQWANAPVPKTAL